ncbi:hypothetical protein ISS05_02740 [Candidatus Woesearchaeota archaeon]|nr:hypothetical protein [Candidatus Woesearchaeota archaeon]
MDNNFNDENNDGSCNASGCPVLGPGYDLNGALFDGIDDYLSYGDIMNLNLPVSISLWVKATDSSKNPILFSEGGTNTHEGFWLYLITGSNANRIEIGYGDGTGTGSNDRNSRVTGEIINQDQWYHVVGIIRGFQDMEIYVDSVSTSASYTGSTDEILYETNSAEMTMGRRITSTGGYDFHSGMIDELYIYDRALTLAEVQMLFGEEPSAYCQDIDGEGYGVCPNCGADNGCEFDGDDCNDSNEHIFPSNTNNYCDCDDSDGFAQGGPEISDGIDNDCNGIIDDMATLNCIDNDGDGYGVCPNCGIANGCDDEGDDCRDDLINVHPGATEIECNDIDDDCVGGDDCPTPGAIIADHNAVDLFDTIPQYWIEYITSNKLVVQLPGQSHGGQFVGYPGGCEGGLELIEEQYPTHKVDISCGKTDSFMDDEALKIIKGRYTGSWGGGPGQADCRQGEEHMWSNDAARTVTINSANEAHSQGITFFSSMYIWCWDIVRPNYCYNNALVRANFDDERRDIYFDAWDEFNANTNNGGTKYVYTTSVTDDDWAYNPPDYIGPDGCRVTIYNEQIRQEAIANEGYLLDLADIENWNDDDTSRRIESAYCDITGQEEDLELCNEQYREDEVCGHSNELLHKRKAKALWWLTSRMAGWDGTPACTSTADCGGSDCVKGICQSKGVISKEKGN